MSNTHSHAASTVAVNERYFHFDQHKVSVEVINDEIFFKASDIGEILGYASTQMALKTLDEDEKLINLLDYSGQKRKTWIINESGLYHLILKSSKPNAKAFRKWVTGTVLPELRKAVFQNPEFHSQKLQILTDLRKRKIQKAIELNDARDKVSGIKKELENIEAEISQVYDSNAAQLSLFGQPNQEGR